MLVHDINYLEWMFGAVQEVSGRQWRLALEDLATEDAGFVTMCFDNGTIAQIGAAMFQRDLTLRLQVIADGGTIRMVEGSKTLEIFDDKTGQWRKGTARNIERDDCFRNQAQHFIDCIQGKAAPICTLEEGEQTLRTVLAALESSDTDGRFVKILR